MTAPDKPAGRGLVLRPSPVKEKAVEAGVEVLQPVRARDQSLAAALRASNLDVATVVAYGKILPADLLAIPPLGFVNVHFSLLPEYRGAAPVQRAVMDGVRETGVSIMVLTEGMDEGPVLATASETIGEDDTAGTLGERLARVGAPLLVETLKGYADGTVKPIEQDHSRATYAARISNEESEIDWNQPAARARDHIRGLAPEPGAWSTLGDRRVKIFAARLADGQELEPGALAATEGRLLVGTKDQALEVMQIQAAGKRAMSGIEFARGQRLTGTERLK